MAKKEARVFLITKHEGMLIAMIEHPPACGMKLKSFDAMGIKVKRN
jgi:hypothetical protein